MDFDVLKKKALANVSQLALFVDESFKNHSTFLQVGLLFIGIYFAQCRTIAIF